MKLLVASVHNLTVLLFFLFYSVCFLILEIFWHWDPFCRKKFPVHVVISILQAFNCQCLDIFVHDIYFFHFFFSLF